MTQTSRCHILATRHSDRTYRCPTTPTRFHYHGDDPAALLRLLVGGRPCAHRHQTPSAAERCSVQAGWRYALTRCQEIARTYGPEDTVTPEDVSQRCAGEAVASFQYGPHRDAGLRNSGLRLCARHAEMYRTQHADRYVEVAFTPAQWGRAR
jgi:hypothetical protein